MKENQDEAIEDVLFFCRWCCVCERDALSQLNSVVTMPAQNLSQSINTACFPVSLAALRSEGIKAEL